MSKKELETEREQERAKGHRGGRRKRPVLTVILIILAVLVAIVIGIAVKFFVDINNPAGLFDQPEPTLAPTEAPTPELTSAIATPEPTPTPTPDPEDVLKPLADLEFMKNRVNILMLGVDESAERESWGSFRTDTMILVSIDFETNDVTMISVPRDSFVKIYTTAGELCSLTSPMNKINSAFSKGGGAQKSGFEYAMRTVQELFGGIPVNYYIGVNMTVVKQLVDAMGGVDYDVDIQVVMNGRTTEPGYQHLTGQQVLDYCRVRKIDSDIKRIDRQQRMLQAILTQLKSSGQIANIPSIYQALEANIATNLSFKQISALALLGLDMDISQLSRHTVEGKAMTVNTASCWCVNTEKLTKLIKEVFGVDVTVDPHIDSAYIKQLVDEMAFNYMTYGADVSLWPVMPETDTSLWAGFKVDAPEPTPVIGLPDGALDGTVEGNPDVGEGVIDIWQ